MNKKLLVLALLLGSSVWVSILAKPVEKMQPLKTGENFKISMGSVAKLKNPLAGTMTIELDAIRGWKHNEKGPLSVNISPPEGLLLGKKSLRKNDRVKNTPHHIRFEVPYQVRQKGSYVVKLKFLFVLCTDKLCQQKKMELDYSLTVS